MERLVQVGDRLGPVTLFDADGVPVELASLLDRPLVVPLVRYYGCMPCKAFLHELEDVRADLEAAGLRVIAVGGADYQARHLMEHGVGFPLLLDPSHRLYAALDLRRIHWWALLKPTTWWKYLRAVRRARQGRITDHPLQAPGLAIVTATARSGSCTGERPSATTHPSRGSSRPRTRWREASGTDPANSGTWLGR